MDLGTPHGAGPIYLSPPWCLFAPLLGFVLQAVEEREALIKSIEEKGQFFRESGDCKSWFSNAEPLVEQVFPSTFNFIAHYVSTCHLSSGSWPGKWTFASSIGQRNRLP